MLPFQTENGKRKPKQFSIIRLTSHHATTSLSFAKKRTKRTSQSMGTKYIEGPGWTGSRYKAAPQSF